MYSKSNSCLSNPAAERAVLAGLCQLGRTAYIEVEHLVDSKCFTDNFNKLVFNSLYELFLNVTFPDPSSIFSIGLANGVTFQADDIQYIKSLFSYNVSQENFVENAKRITKLKIARECQNILLTAHDKLKEVSGKETIHEILSIPENIIFDYIYQLSSGEEGPKQVATDGRDRLIELMENPVDMVGLPTPFNIYNTATGGIRSGVSLIFARKKTGKSFMAATQAIFSAKQDIKVLMLDTEMSKEEQQDRMLAALSNVHIGKIETGKIGDNLFEKKQVFEALETLEKLPIQHNQVTGQSFDEILSSVRRWHHKDVGIGNPCLVIYDYFKIMDKEDIAKMPEYQAIGFQISKLSDFCKNNDIPCLAFTQANRQEDISQSDRLGWICTSISYLSKKTQEEIDEDGHENGNRKLIVQDCRYGEGLPDNNWINIKADLGYGKLEEINTNYDVIKKKKKNDSSGKDSDNS